MEEWKSGRGCSGWWGGEVSQVDTSKNLELRETLLAYAHRCALPHARPDSSMGGVIVAHFAATHPQAVRSLTMLSPAVGRSDPASIENGAPPPMP